MAFFFFLSGYGVEKQYLTREGYFDGFLRRRLPKVMIPYGIAILLYWGYHALAGEVYSPLYVLDSLVNGAPIVSSSWFIIVILVFYMVFWAGMALQRRLVPGKGKNAFLIGVVAVFALVWMYICQGRDFLSYWFTTVHILVIGIVWAIYKEKLSGIFHRFWLPLTVVCWGSVFFINNCWEWLSGFLPFHPVAFLRMLETPLYVFGVLLAAMKLKFGNAPLRFLGKISLEIYLTHGLFIDLFSRLGVPEIPAVFATLAASVAAAYLFHRLNEAILTRLYKKKSA